MMDLVTGCKPDVNEQKPDVNTETGEEERAQEQTVVSVDREHRDGCASWIMTAIARSKAMARCSAKFCEH